MIKLPQVSDFKTELVYGEPGEMKYFILADNTIAVCKSETSYCCLQHVNSDGSMSIASASGTAKSDMTIDAFNASVVEHLRIKSIIGKDDAVSLINAFYFIYDNENNVVDSGRRLKMGDYNSAYSYVAIEDVQKGFTIPWAVSKKDISSNVVDWGQCV